ncbi:peptidase M23 [Dokdonia pacifica]|uniref:Murein DD-endopeptidase MepM and murein hydrolase activator NlpD, contain LysM domain n=1 Tax=Dokdonia pacifica TaxID=1627892 RepID=A0A238W222_9FLAO|nr:M23 family metallopeptidase [Dokdonia pacifica]GGG15732.1 peptidase M23 [Dokdonia pacifica]SNR40404.1 Murein DD-endopeptidase MepM and murein hydrolase activator NlpD, contain LysM domain [Dokdonia pacifica]
MNLRRILTVLLLAISIVACGDKEQKPEPAPEVKTVEKPPLQAYGYTLDDFIVERDTVKSGDSFGKILFESHVDYGTIQQISDTIKEVFDTRKIDLGKPYVLLKSKDTTETAQVFIYEKNKEDYVVIDFQDEIIAAEKSHPVTIVEREISGIINSNLSSTFDELDTNVLVAYKMADIYAWTIDFFKLQEGDRFKVVYEERYVNDSIAAGIGRIKASVFEHKGRPVYAYLFEHDSLPGGSDYFDEKGDNLRRAFLKGPLKFNRVSSRYNLKRRIKYYGYKVRPHKGTDFAGSIGTPILATADGTVTKSERRGGNGNYVKIRHNGTYETQYLHMQKRKVRVGDFVRQGEVIGTIGMTGNTGGPHVCYRFWKNGRQVDPFKEDLPASEPLAEDLKPIYDSIMQPLEKQLEGISFPESDTNIDTSTTLQEQDL